MALDLERRNELEMYIEDYQPDAKGLRTVMVTGPDHRYSGAWWQPGHGLGYAYASAHTIKVLMDGVAAGSGPASTFEAGYRGPELLDAGEHNSESRGWVGPEYGGI